MSVDLDPKLQKIIALAKSGIGGEKDSAIALVRKICEREGIDFDDVMSDHDDFREFDAKFTWRNDAERQVVINVIYRFALTEEHPKMTGVNEKYKRLWYITTISKHLETLYAAQVYLRAFRKEQKKILDDLQAAFLSKHHIFATFDTKREEEEDKPIDIEKLQRQMAIMNNMDDVKIQKQIGE